MIQLYQTTLPQTSSDKDPKLLRLEARAFLVSCLGDFLNEDPKSLSLEHLASGRPVLKNHPDLSFSLSHSENQVAVVCSKTFNVGVDLQHQYKFNEKLFARICTGNELQNLSKKDAESFYLLWTVKEAVMKCIGLGFQYPMDHIEIDINKKQIQLLAEKEYSMALNYPWNHLEFTGFKAPANFVGHVAWAAHPGHPNYKPSFSLRA